MKRLSTIIPDILNEYLFDGFERDKAETILKEALSKNIYSIIELSSSDEEILKSLKIILTQELKYNKKLYSSMMDKETVIERFVYKLCHLLKITDCFYNRELVDEIVKDLMNYYYCSSKYDLHYFDYGTALLETTINKSKGEIYSTNLLDLPDEIFGFKIEQEVINIVTDRVILYIQNLAIKRDSELICEHCNNCVEYNHYYTIHENEDNKIFCSKDCISFYYAGLDSNELYILSDTIPF